MGNPPWDAAFDKLHTAYHYCIGADRDPRRRDEGVEGSRDELSRFEIACWNRVGIVLESTRQASRARGLGTLRHSKYEPGTGSV
jgi:hypothetical protein